jgi:hypothetical protein
MAFIKYYGPMSCITPSRVSEVKGNGSIVFFRKAFNAHRTLFSVVFSAKPLNIEVLV